MVWRSVARLLNDSIRNRIYHFEALLFSSTCFLYYSRGPSVTSQNIVGIIAKQSLANAVYTYTGIGLGALLTLFLYPTILNPDQYGLTRVLISGSIIGAQFAHLGMRNTIIRFFPLFHQIGGRRSGLLFLALVVPMAGYLLFLLLFFLFDDLLLSLYLERSPLLSDHWLLILPITFFILYFEIFNSYLRSFRDSITGSLISEVILRIAVMISLGIYLMEWVSFNGFLILFTSAYAIQPLLLLGELARTGRFNPSLTPTLLKRPLLRGMARYGLFTLFGGLTTVVVWNVDVLMVSSMIGLEATAVYAIAFYIGTVIAVPQRAIERIATPLISEFIHEKRWDEVEDIYRRTSLTQLIAGSGILLLVWSNTVPLLQLLPDAYHGGHWVVLIIGLGKLIDMATGVNGSIILTSKHYRFDLLANLLLILFTVSSNLILIPRLGIEGAALATAFSLLLYNLIKFLFVRHTWSMSPFGFSHLLVVAAALVAVGALQLLPVLPLWGHLPLTILLTGLLFLLPVHLLRLSQDLSQALDPILPEWFGPNHSKRP